MALTKDPEKKKALLRNYRDTFLEQDIRNLVKELDETAYWLELLTESSILPNAKLADLRDEGDQLLAIFTTISKKAKVTSS